MEYYNLLSKNNNEILDKIAKMILDSTYFVVFTGAGISTASGLPDFRGPNGVWTLRDKGIKPTPPSKPWSEFEPNDAHYALVELKNLKLLKFLISQNVENLHIKSGINQDLIAELHGNSTIWKCVECDTRFLGSEIDWDVKKFGRGYRTQPSHPEQPNCLKCGGRLINSVVNFNDPMPEKEMRLAKFHTSKSDLFMVVGSSLLVHPAASFPRLAKRNDAKLIIINMGETGGDDIADIKVEADCSIVLPKIVNLIKKGN